MCGIAGIVSSEADVPNGAVEKMAASLRHRGPDAEETVALTGCHLGHTRLSVIDLTGGRQPMQDETGRYHIVFNGEIFNYRELRDELAAEGTLFRTASDTEVLLHAYRRHGEGVLERLNGQFAFLIWDAQERIAFLARDRFGEKPLFWARSRSGHLLIASEIKALLASGLIEPVIDRTSVDAYLALLYVPSDRTIYSNIFTVRPAHAMVWRGNNCRERCYWQPRYSTERIEVPEAVDRLRLLTRQAVKRQMVADVPVGAFLSGGLDSSTIVALMAAESPRPIMTFSVGFGGLINELPYAREVAEAYRTQHHELQVDVPVSETLEEMARVYDEPFADSSNIPTFLLCRFVREHVKVALSGDGGDELFGGYEWYERLGASQHYAPGPSAFYARWLRAAFWRGLVTMGGHVAAQRDAALRELLTARLARRHADIWDRHVLGNGNLAGDRSELWGSKVPEDTDSAIRKNFFPADRVSGIDRATDFDVRCYLPGDILVKVDRAAMANGLETRAPFLDRELAEFVLSLSSTIRFRPIGLKELMRDAYAELWPTSVRQRKKQGFGAPIRMWLQAPAMQSMFKRVRRPGGPLSALLPGVNSVGNATKPQRIWTLLCLGLWLDKHPECHASLP